MGTTAGSSDVGAAGRAGAPVPAERDLVARARAGDQGAFRELVDRHRDRAYGLALRIVRSPPDAEEVAQDAFVRAWLALPLFRGAASFSTWLHRIVARRAFDRRAALQSRRGRETALGPTHETAAAAPGPETERLVTARRLERLMAELSAAQRAAVTLYHYEGRSIEQAAAALGMPPNTVKTHLRRARAALRSAWLREWGEGAP